MKKNHLKSFTVLAASFLLWGCSEEKAQPVKSTSAVLAEVGNTQITQEELDLVLEKLTTGLKLGQDEKSDVIRKNALESLVRSRAMAIKVTESMSDEKKRWFDLKAQAYKEELMVKEYLNQQIRPVPVSNEMVKSYYQKHPGKFGGSVVREFEYVSLSNYTLQSSDESDVIDALKSLQEQKDWGGEVEKLQKLHEWNMTYKKARMDIALLRPPLKDLIAFANADGTVNQVGKVVAGSKKDVLIGRVLSEKPTAPKPLAEVSAEIRKMLAPVQLKEAVRKVSDDALSTVDVIYKNETE